MSLHVNRTAHMVCNFSCLIGTEGLFKVIGSQLNCKSGNVRNGAWWYRRCFCTSL